MMKSISDEKGHYIVEAAIILPLILIAILTIGCIGKVAAIRENIIYAAIDEARWALTYSPINESQLFLTKRLEERIREENTNIESIYVKDFNGRYSVGEFDSLIYFKIEYKIKINGPLPLINQVTKQDSILCRKFVGDKKKKNSFTFEAMEKNQDGNTVYIFPTDGKRYHREECSYVKPKIIEEILTKDIKKEYQACEICHTENVKEGTIVYLFPEYGDAYHKRECDTVERNTVEIEITIAEERGYSKCSKCGG